MYETRDIYGRASAAGRVGPYDAEVFWDPRRDIVTIKFRRQDGVEPTRKLGVKYRLSMELIEGTMEQVPPGGEYPEVGLTWSR